MGFDSQFFVCSFKDKPTRLIALGAVTITSAFSSLSVTFYGESRRNLEKPQPPKQKSNPKQTHPIHQNNYFSLIRETISGEV
jgi:hypothetical protein